MALPQGSDPNASSAARHGVITRPPRQLPPGYTPPALHPGYTPRRPDLQTSGALAKAARRGVLSRAQLVALALGAAGLLAALVIATLIVVSTVLVQATTSPETAAQTFYGALVTQDYPHAYAQLSPSAQVTQSQTQFANHYEQLDTLSGPVARFTIGAVSVNGGHATVTVTYYRAANASHATLDTLQLTQHNGVWLIDSIASREVTTGQP